MKNIIKAGYRIHVTTCENDGDNYRTKIKQDLPEDHTVRRANPGLS